MEKTQKNILILGASGMLGKAICKCLGPGYKIIPLSHKECDITDKERLAKVFGRFRPWVVIHPAAYKDVDGCELNRPKAFRVNAAGTRNVACGCRVHGSILIYISSDYVFDGTKDRPYREIDRTHPLSVYGKSKLKGEEFVRRLLSRFIIIRTCWLFGGGGRNFVDDMLKRAKTTKDISVVSDKFASPTYVNDLACAIKKIIDMIDSPSWRRSLYGIYHITNSGFCSWYDYASSIFRSAGIGTIKIRPIKMEEINFKARRPAFSALDNAKYIKLTKSRLRPWQAAVKEYLKKSF